MDSLISPKQPDGFKTESPIRAFTDFQVSGQYAIGKGFRPSMAHLSRYLDAMEAKEGWALVQIILPDNDAADPTILFRKTVLELTSDMAIMPEVVDLTIRKIVIGLGQLRDDMIAQAEARMEDTSVEAKGFLSEAMDQYADRAAGYAAELAALVPVHGAEAIMRQMIAHHGEAVGRAIRKHPALGEPYQPSEPHWTDHGSDLDIPLAEHGNAVAFVGNRLGIETLLRDYRTYWPEEQAKFPADKQSLFSRIKFIIPMRDDLAIKQAIDAFRIHRRPDPYQTFAATIRGKCDWEMVDDFLKEQGFSLVTNGPDEIRIYRADAPLATGSDATALSSDEPGDLGRQLEA